MRQPVGFVDVEDEITGEKDNEDVIEESDSIADYETDDDNIEEGPLTVTSGSMVIIRDIKSWLRSPYVED